jgi:PQQ-dependent catabolism-associated CXXCW motif protein
MAEPVYDQLALALREFSARFGETAFTDRRRLTSLLSDRMPEARREIRVVSSAIDERVFETLARTRPEQIGMEMDRLAARLENAAGIRTDIALSTVRACAYGLGLAPLPSSQSAVRGAPPPPPMPPMPPQEGSWVGVSQPVTAPQPPTYRPPQGAPPAAPVPVHVPPPFTPPPFQQTLAPAKTGWSMPKILVGGGIGLAVVLVGLYMLGSVEPDPVPPAAPSRVVTPPTPPPATLPSTQPSTPTRPPPRPPQTPPATPTNTTIPIPPAPARANGYGDEFLNFGVQAQETVQNNVGTPTPTSIPGGRFVSTTELSDEMRKGTTFLLVDSLEDAHPQTIIRAVSIPYAGRAGNLYDDNEESLKETLNRLTQGRTDYPLVFFCQGVRCWESYNAALRAIAAGYRNVLWYRGGIYAWTQAGLPTQPTR